jgi:UPF0755 protein
MSAYRMRRPKSRAAKFTVIFLFVLLAAIVATVVYIRAQYYKNLEPLSQSQANILINIESGSTAAEIAATLKDSDVIRETWAFEWYVRNNGLRDDLQAGTYYLSPSQSVPEIAQILTKGRVATDLVTILPGKRIDQIKQSLVNAGFAPPDVEQALDPARYAGHPALVDKPVNASLEGYIYPESFQMSPNTKPEVVIRAALDEMQKSLTPDVRAGIVRQGLTVHQGVILASIVEKEVGVADDRPVVAQVFLKRLKEGIKLESDATTSYGAIVAGDVPTGTYNSPYNTYQNPGLTPGPISNVSASSLRAVAAPAGTDFLYFVAGNDCKTRFSKTFAEHEAFINAHGVGCR